MQSMKETYDPPRPQWQLFLGMYVVCLVYAFALDLAYERFVDQRVKNAARLLAAKVSR